MSHSSSALERAISEIGGVSALARALGIHSQSVSQWRNGSTSITPQRAIEIEHATGGVVTKEQLRPDIFGEPKKGKAA